MEVSGGGDSMCVLFGGCFFLDSASSLGFGECDSYRYLVLLAG